MKIHPSITPERLEAAAKDSMFGMGNPGFCLACGEDATGVEPDARNYRCDWCDARQVYGAEEVLMMVGF